jgi:predicted DsbA family dithiol-disulfide isomerase
MPWCFVKCAHMSTAIISLPSFFTAPRQWNIFKADSGMTKCCVGMIALRQKIYSAKGCESQILLLVLNNKLIRGR